MNLFAFSGFLWGITTLSLGVFVLIVGKNKVHRLWAIFNLNITIWAFGYAMAAMSKDIDTARFWWRFAHIGGNINTVILLHAVCVIGDLKRRLLLTFGYLQSVIFVVLAFAGYTGSDLQYLFNSFYYPSLYFYSIKSIGLYFPIFVPIWLFYLIYALYELYTIYRKSYGVNKKNSGWFFVGITTGYVGSALTLLPLFYTKLYPYWNFTVPLYCIVVTYAIFRHQMLNIEVIIKKTLVFAGLLAAVSAMLLLPTFVIQEYLIGTATLGGRILGLTISGIIIILAMRKIEDFLINITDKTLFQKKYDYKELLKTFTSEVLTVLDIDVLVHTTVDRLSHIMKIQSCGLLLLNKTKNQYELVASVGVDKEWRKVTLGTDNTLATFLSRTRSYLSTKHQGKDSPLPKHIIEDMNRLKLELAIPLNIHDDMIGILTLGKKKSDEDYVQDDMDILLPLARTLAIALSNANMLVELGKTQAEAAQREKMAVIGTLSAGINHEICNPLGIARGQCEAYLLNIKDGLYKKKTSEELLEKAQKIMEKVIHETDRATAITKRLSSFAKPSKGLLSEVININEEMDEVLALVGYELKLDKVDIIKDIDKDLPTIAGDKKQLQEVFFNLIRNAAQAIEERGKITIRAKQHERKILVEIEDTGHGIPEDKIDQIFNPFFTTKEPGKGTGLGLFIVRQVVERNKGRISVKSKVGEGTTFMLEFPVAAKEKVT